MGMVEDRAEQSRRELDAYNRMANPNAYIQSGQLDRDYIAGRIDQTDIQAVSDAAHQQRKRLATNENL